MPVYFVAELQITDADRYAAYLASVSSIIRAYGGRYVVRGGRPETLDGDWKPDRLVVIAFDSLTRMRACFASQEYLALAPLRERAMLTRAVAVPGALQDEPHEAASAALGPPMSGG